MRFHSFVPADLVKHFAEDNNNHYNDFLKNWKLLSDVEEGHYIINSFLELSNSSKILNHLNKIFNKNDVKDIVHYLETRDPKSQICTGQDQLMLWLNIESEAYSRSFSKTIRECTAYAASEEEEPVPETKKSKRPRKENDYRERCIREGLAINNTLCMLAKANQKKKSKA